MRGAILLTLAVLFLAPFAWMVNASLKAEGTATLTPFTPPDPPRPANYVRALDQMGSFDEESHGRGFGRLVANTAVITGLSVLFQVFTCSLAGFAFARLRFWGRDVLFLFVLATMMLPVQVTVIPQFILFQGLGWIDTILPLVVPCLLGGSPFFIFLFRQYFLTIPQDVIDAARMDGCGWWGIYWRILMPLGRPVAATVAIFTFLWTWNDLWTPLVYLISPEKQTLTLALAGFSRSYNTAVELLMAATTVVLVPCIAVYLLTQRTFVRGVRLKATKG